MQGLSKDLQKKYAARVPTLAVFEEEGKLVEKFSTFPTKEKTLLDKLAALKKDADKAKDKTTKDKAKDTPKK